MNKHFSEAIRFLIVGTLAVLTDLIFYLILSYYGISVNLSKFISYIIGAIVGFIFNKTWTFKSKGKINTEIIFFSILYFVSLNMNVITNKLCLELLNLKLISFLVATTVSTLINYVGQKFIVFREVNHG